MLFSLYQVLNYRFSSVGCIVLVKDLAFKCLKLLKDVRTFLSVKNANCRTQRYPFLMGKPANEHRDSYTQQPAGVVILKLTSVCISGIPLSPLVGAGWSRQAGHPSYGARTRGDPRNPALILPRTRSHPLPPICLHCQHCGDGNGGWRGPGDRGLQRPAVGQVTRELTFGPRLDGRNRN